MDTLKETQSEEQIKTISYHMKEVLRTLGLDVENDPSLSKTPERIAKMYVNEVFSGLKEENFPATSFVPNEYDHTATQGVIQTKASFTSYCEHHFVPVVGVAQVAYIPRKKLIGLSKVPRIVRYYARRPQLQERLTGQIADCMSRILETPDVAVIIKARHHCVLTRGIEDRCSDTSSQVLLGAFQNKEFYDMINRDLAVL